MTANIKIPFTSSAFSEMQTEQARLTRELAEVMERLKTAREMGDLSENGAYKYAKFEIGSIRRQLSKINYLLKNGQISQPNTNKHVVSFGSTVRVKTNNSLKPISFMLVSTHEADPLNGKLSVESPIGLALMHKKVGDQITIQAPSGQIEYILLEII